MEESLACRALITSVRRNCFVAMSTSRSHRGQAGSTSAAEPRDLCSSVAPSSQCGRANGSSMAPQWLSYGSLTGSVTVLRFISYVSSMDLVWISYGSGMDCFWLLDDSRMVLTGGTLGYQCFLLATIWLSNGFEWFSMGFMAVWLLNG